MKLRIVVVMGLALMLAACTSLRITGSVTDAQTGEPISTGGVVSGPRSARMDPIGRYTIGVKRDWKTLEFVVPGYERKTVPFDASETRYPIINVELVPKATKTTSHSAATRGVGKSAP